MFEVGKEYKRSIDIHGVYGGQAQGGISTPKSYPVIFLFTSDEGEQHGYKMNLWTAFSGIPKKGS